MAPMPIKNRKEVVIWVVAKLALHVYCILIRLVWWGARIEPSLRHICKLKAEASTSHVLCGAVLQAIQVVVLTDGPFCWSVGRDPGKIWGISVDSVPPGAVFGQSPGFFLCTCKKGPSVYHTLG